MSPSRKSHKSLDLTLHKIYFPMFLNHDADEEIINFQEVNNTPDLSPKHSAERKSEKVTKIHKFSAEPN